MDSLKKTAVIIDDEEEMTHLLKIELEQAGYNAYVAYDGEEGFRQIRKVNPDVVILDILMPGLDGFEMLRILKADDTTKDIPIVVLTAKVHAKDIQKGKELGASLYIKKPFDAVKLIQAIHEIVEKD